jgi:glycosyltransferase involved in cell wall biosynthesis
MTRLSVVLPNRNHARELQVSLGAIVAQTRPADDIVIIDDASTDDSVAVIERFAAERPAIRLVRNSQQRGVAESVRRGLELAKGDYVMMASADECLVEDAFERLVEAMDAHPQAKLAVSIYTHWFPDEDRLLVHDAESEHGMWYVRGPETEFVSPENFSALLKERFVWLSINSAMFRREALLEVGGFDPALRWHSDWFAIYAVAFRYGFCAVPHSLAWFRVDGKSYSGAGMRDRRAQEGVALAIQKKICEPEFRDIDRAVGRAPVVMSTFMRETLTAMAKRPHLYPRLAPLLLWWAGEVCRGRRPSSWARFVRRMSGSAGEGPSHHARET